MNPQTIAAWTATAQALIGAGITTAAGIRSLIKMFHGDRTEQELNDICDQIFADASVRQAIADRDAGQGAGTGERNEE